MPLTLEFKGGKDRGRALTFDSSPVLIGSSPRAALVIDDDPLIAEEHLLIEFEDGGGYRVHDLKTASGTFLNGRRLAESRVLSNGDLIRAGLTMFEATLSAVERPVVERPVVERPDGESSPPDTIVGPLDEPYEAIQPAHGGDDPGMVADPDDDPRLRALLARAVAVEGYDLGRPLGRGSFGRVYQARRQSNGSFVAVKVLSDLAADSTRVLPLFAREVEIHQQLDHPQIVRMISSGELGGRVAWFVMEYVDGQNLDIVLNEAAGPFSIPDACGVASQVLEALDYAHNLAPPVGPIVHRDVKLSNILISGSTGRYAAKLADFGLAKNFAMAGYSGITATGKACGTLEFMSPEQLKDSKYSGPEVDLYAVGGVLFYCLTGRLIYDVPPTATATQLLSAVLTRKMVSLQSLRPEVPTALEKVIDRAVGRDDLRRFRTARQMIRALEGVMTSWDTGEASTDVGDGPDRS